MWRDEENSWYLYQANLPVGYEGEQGSAGKMRRDSWTNGGKEGDSSKREGEVSMGREGVNLPGPSTVGV